MPSRAAKFQIFIDGQPLSDGAVRCIDSVVHQASFFESAMVKVVFAEGASFDLDFDQVRFDTPFELHLGYHNRLQKVFTGEVVKIKPQFAIDTPSKLVLTALDFSDNMKDVPDPSVWRSRSIYQIAGEIIKRNNMRAVIEPAGPVQSFKHKSDQAVLQKQKSDWEILSQLAKKLNYFLFCRHDTVYLVNRDHMRTLQGQAFEFIEKADASELDETTKFSLMEFKPGADRERQKTEVVVKSWQPFYADGKLIVKQNLNHISTEEPGFTEIRVKTTKTEVLVIEDIVRNHDQAVALARAELEQRAQDLVKGDVMVPGNAKINIGDVHIFTLRSFRTFGRAFTGPYFIKRVRNRYSKDRGFVTEVDVSRETLTNVT
jgi:phage protein D